MASRDFPSIRDLAEWLHSVAHWYSADDIGKNEEGEAWLDVRLQVEPGEGWSPHSGDASYDQSHLGYWGAGSIRIGSSKRECREVARDLIDQARDMEAEAT